MHETRHDVAALPLGYYSAMNRRRRRSDETEDAQRRNQFFFPQLLIDTVLWICSELYAMSRAVGWSGSDPRSRDAEVRCSKVVRLVVVVVQEERER
ncbi:hypothetical protein Aduo_019389 [Ancylostoma duodenale]